MKSKIAVCVALTLSLTVLAGASRKPTLPKVGELNFTFVKFPEKQSGELKGEDKKLGILAEALKGIKPKKGGKTKVVEFKGIPFLHASIARPIVLAGERGEVSIPVDDSPNTLYLLFAMINPDEKGLQGTCRIVRGDGITIPIRWERSLNVGPSTGKWKNDLKPKKERPATTQLIWEGKTKKGVPVRLFCTVWFNENEWYPINNLKWKLKNKTASIVLLGVTKGKYKD